MRHISIVVLVALAVAGARAQQSPPRRPTAVAECVPNAGLRLQERLDAVNAEPTRFLPKLELARCYDLSWRMGDVEPAILNALAALRVEARTRPIATAPLPAGAHLAGVELPELSRVSQAAPEYPPRAFVEGVAGLVIVEVVVDKDGKVKQARAPESVAVLDDAAIQAVKKWRFAPPHRDGQLVEAVTYVPIRFGQTRELWASDWMHVARFHFARGLPQLAEAALDQARDRAQRDYERYGEISSVTGTAGRLAVPPTRTKYVVPALPPAARSASGVVLLQLLVDRFGDVGRSVVLKSVPMLDMAAQQGVLQWKFSPAKAGGQPVSMSISTVVAFSRR